MGDQLLRREANSDGEAGRGRPAPTGGTIRGYGIWPTARSVLDNARQPSEGDTGSMDFHDDQTAFDSTSTDDVSHMYVPDTDDHPVGDDTTGPDTGSDDTHGTEPTGSHSGDTVSVDVGGREVTADATIDVDHDGQEDTAIVTDAAGDHIAITDTDGDGDADHAALLDKSGHVLDTAHLDSSGNWVQDGPGDSNPYGAAGTTVGTGTPTGGTDGTPTGGTGGGTDGGATPGDHTITVEAGGHTVDAQATVDADHDGTSDTAVVQAPDGNKIAFSDSDGDGQADRAAVYDSNGQLVGTAHYDRSSGTWVEGSDGGAPPTLPDSQPGTTTAGGGATGGIGEGSSTGSGDQSVGSESAGDRSVGSESAGDRSGGAGGGIGTSPAGGTGSGGGEHIEVNVGGQSAQVEADYDLDRDGRDETAVVQAPDGTRIAFSDTDGDGDADRASVYDSDGKLVGTASYDEGSGTWVEDGA